MINILVLGVSGMLGSMVFDYLNQCSDFCLYGTARKFEDLPFEKQILPFHADINTDTTLIELLKNTKPDYIINCIGIIKPYCRDDDKTGIWNAIKINAHFPYLLSKVACQMNNNIKIIQIATDCVYDGANGMYSEKDPHNAIDVYGKTKSLGEVNTESLLNIRCSIIGPEIKSNVSLLGWFLSLNNHAEVTGYTNHIWNGITTLQFAQLCKRIIEQKLFKTLRDKNHVIHYIENEKVSKFDLLTLFKEIFGKQIKINNNISGIIPVDRSLTSVYLTPGNKSMKEAVTELKEHITKTHIYD